MARLSIVIQKILQLSRHRIASRLTIRSAALSRASSALQPDFSILWKVSIFQRRPYQRSFAIADMHDALRLCEKCSGLLHVLQLAIALLLLDRHARWVDRALQRVRAVELVPGPELDSGQSKRKPLLGHGQAGVHQHATHRVI